MPEKQNISRGAAENAEENLIEIRAITVLQPWASLIVFGEKCYETRSWKTNYRGRIAIHSGKNDKFMQFPNYCKEPFLQYFFPKPDIPNYEFESLPEEEQKKLCDEAYNKSFKKKMTEFYKNKDIYFGYLIGIATLVDCFPTEEIINNLATKELELGNFSKGRWAWKLEDIHPIEPWGVNGKQGLWKITIPKEVING
jgi:hypothetical protein